MCTFLFNVYEFSLLGSHNSISLSKHSKSAYITCGTLNDFLSDIYFNFFFHFSGIIGLQYLLLLHNLSCFFKAFCVLYACKQFKQ